MSSLAISSGTLKPAFLSTVYNYTADVGVFTKAITITPQANDPAATMMVNGIALVSGTESHFYQALIK